MTGGGKWSRVHAETPGIGCILNRNFRGSLVLPAAEAVIIAVRTLNSGGQGELSWQSPREREFVDVQAMKDILLG